MKKSLMFLALFLVLPLAVSAFDNNDSGVVPCGPDTLVSPSVATCLWGPEHHILMVVRPKALGASDVEPLLYLLGGPGTLALPQTVRFQDMADRLSRSVLVPAFGDSYLELMCDRGGEDDAVWGIGKQPDEAVIYTRSLQQQRLDECLNQIVDPVRASSAGTDLFADSLNQLRRTLAISRWHVMGESYGGRLAISLAGKDPSGTGHLILDSPDTPWVPGYFDTAENFHSALERLSDLCRDDYYCIGRRQRLDRSLLEKVSGHDPATSEPVALKNIRTGDVSAYARPTRAQLLISAFGALRRPDRASLLPYIAVARRQEDFLARYGLLLDQLLYPSSSLNIGLFHAIRCRELALDQWYSVMENSSRGSGTSALTDYLAWRQQHVCAALGITPPEDSFTPQIPGIPILLLTGGFDPITPASVTTRAVAGRNRVSHLHFGSLGHVVSSQKTCVMDDIAHFLEGGDTKRTSCKRRDLKLRFYAPVVIR